MIPGIYLGGGTWGIIFVAVGGEVETSMCLDSTLALRFLAQQGNVSDVSIVFPYRSVCLHPDYLCCVKCTCREQRGSRAIRGRTGFRYT